MNEETAIRYLLLGVVQTLVRHPDEVRVVRIPCDIGYAFEISVYPSDLKMVLGAQGRTAKALRVIAGGATKATRTRVTLIFSGESRPN